MRRSFAGLAVLTLALAVTPALPTQLAAADEPCQKLPSWHSFDIEGIDPSGRFKVVTTRGDGMATTGIGIFRNGVAADLVPITRASYTEANDVNVRGVAVGSVSGSGSNPIPFAAWRITSAGKTVLPEAESSRVFGSKPVAINAAGEIAGTGNLDTHGEGHITKRAVLWSPDNVIRVLPVPAGFTDATATDIDDDGTVVGYATDVDANSMPANQQPVVWPADGGYRILPTSNTVDGYSTVEAVRNGIAVGADNEQAVSWRLDGDTKTILDPTASWSLARFVNAGGDILVERTAGADGGWVSTSDLIRRGQPAQHVGDRISYGLDDFGRAYVRYVGSC
ncbi:hypothetical protein OG474_10485 [Kribbella sp. NBC_01505]|uniref:hypothetical protein n=1 Tax=Kribbella sp. NBC_01505 TaxID=2903580 RepID=UPI0038690D11